MNRRTTFALACLALLSLVAAGCGQKPGVAFSQSAITEGGGGGTGTGEDTATADGGTLAGENQTGTGGSTGTTGGTSGGTGTGRTTTGGKTGGGGTGGGGGSFEGGADSTGISATEIKIGIHAPVTGAAAVSTFKQGVGVYSNWAGQIPGLRNRKITVLDRDDKFNPSEARLVCKDLVENQKVFVLIGGAGADQIKACAEYAHSKGVPYLSPGVTEGGFSTLPGYFAISETYNQQNVQLLPFVKNTVKKTKLGVLLTDSPLLNETLTSVKAEATRNGVEVVYDGRLPKDGNRTHTDTQVRNLQAAKADVVYALIPPTVFAFLINSARDQQYFPNYVGPGLSIGVNLVAKPVCANPPVPTIQYFSPMVQMDKVEEYDSNYRTAYSQKPGNTAADRPDDIGILLWGVEKTVRLMVEAAGPDPTRQKFVQVLESGQVIDSKVFAPVKYGKTPHFGASQVTLLTLNCSPNRLEYDTTKAHGSSF